MFLSKDLFEDDVKPLSGQEHNFQLDQKNVYREGEQQGYAYNIEDYQSKDPYIARANWNFIERSLPTTASTENGEDQRPVPNNSDELIRGVSSDEVLTPDEQFRKLMLISDYRDKENVFPPAPRPLTAPVVLTGETAMSVVDVGARNDKKGGASTIPIRHHRKTKILADHSGRSTTPRQEDRSRNSAFLFVGEQQDTDLDLDNALNNELAKLDRDFDKATRQRELQRQAKNNKLGNNSSKNGNAINPRAAAPRWRAAEARERVRAGIMNESSTAATSPQREEIESQSGAIVVPKSRERRRSQYDSLRGPGSASGNDRGRPTSAGGRMTPRIQGPSPEYYRELMGVDMQQTGSGMLNTEPIINYAQMDMDEMEMDPDPPHDQEHHIFTYQENDIIVSEGQQGAPILELQLAEEIEEARRQQLLQSNAGIYSSPYANYSSNSGPAQVPASSGAGGAGVSSSVGLPQYAGGGSVGSTSYRGDGEDAMTRQQKLQQQRAMMQRKMGGGGAVTQSYGLIRSNQGFGGNQGLSPEEPSQPRRKSTADLFEVPEPTRPSFSEDPPAPPPDPSTAGTTSSTFDNNASGAPAAATILSSAPSCEVEVDTTSDVISEAGSDFNEMNPQFHGGNSDAPVAIDDTELPVVEAVSPVQLQNDHLSPKHTEYQLQSRGLASVFDPCASTNTQSGSLYSGGGNPMGDPLANSLSLGARRFLPSMIGPSLPQFLMNRLPRGVLMECYVTRSGGLASKFYPKYKMFTEQGAFFLMSSQKRKKNKTSNYCISMGENDLNPQGVNCLGKLRSNFMGSEFVAYSNGLNPNKGGNRRPEDYREELCAITYSSTIWGRLSVTGKKPRGPRQMNVIIPKLRQPDDQPIVCRPLHANDAGLLSAAKSFGVVPGGGSSSSSNGAPSAPPSGTNGFQPNTTAQGNVMMQPNGAMQHLSGVDGGMSSSAHHSYNNANNPLQQLHQAPIDVYQNKAPKWNDQLGAFVLNFNKRVTQASVKNFQLVSAHDPDTVLLQFGRVGKDTFNMDFRYPLSPYQAFAIVLSSFDYKLCCE